MPIKWSADGFPYMTQSKDTIPLVLHRKGIKREKNVTFGNFTWRDDFTGKTLRPEWLSIWGSAEKYYKTGNGLRLILRTDNPERPPHTGLHRPKVANITNTPLPRVSDSSPKREKPQDCYWSKTKSINISWPYAKATSPCCK